MLKFDYNGNSYQVRFQRSTRTVEELQRLGLLSEFHRVITKNPKDEFIRRVVSARIDCKLPTGTKTEATGISVCNPNDKFDPAKGRRLALNRAIKQKRKNDPTSLPKAMTAAMWSAYFSTVRDGKNNGSRPAER